MSMQTKELKEKINLLINTALGAGLTAAQINTALTNAATNLTAVTPAPTHDRTIKDPGAALNPSQP
jgi:hypothetical protein